LFFNGAYDVICNHVGNEKALMRLTWSGENDYLNAPRGVWLPKGQTQPGGYSKSFGPLTYLIVLNSGHMVPLDVPKAALEMVSRFLQGQSFADKPQPITMSAASPLLPAAVASPPETPGLTGR